MATSIAIAEPREPRELDTAEAFALVGCKTPTVRVPGDSTISIRDGKVFVALKECREKSQRCDERCDERRAEEGEGQVIVLCGETAILCYDGRKQVVMQMCRSCFARWC